MLRSTIESLIKLPLQIPFETSVPSKKEAELKNSGNKSAHKKEMVEHIDDSKEVEPQGESTAHSKGYIKYPRYDFF